MQRQALINKCGFTKVLNTPFEETVRKTREVLKNYGFGIITEIDMKQIMKEKLGLNYPSFMILGACNPQLAHKALEVEPAVALLLPCNVAVRDINGKTEVSAVNPKELVSLVMNDKLEPIVNEAYEGLKKAIDSL